MALSPLRLRLDRREVTSRVDPRIFGGFLEHVGRAVYEGVFDPSSRYADAEGYRSDVLDALRGLRFTTMRYPGGNFVSGYNWRDGVGPRALRTTRFERAWLSWEPNTFGTDEFVALCRRMDWTPMMAVNLGRGGPEEAAALVEYCNGPVGTREGDRRARNASEEPGSMRIPRPHEWKLSRSRKPNVLVQRPAETVRCGALLAASCASFIAGVGTRSTK